MAKIKICGLFRDKDIDFVNELMPDYAGFIVNFPKSHRNLDYDKAKNLISKLDSKIKSVCVLVNQSIETVEQFSEICDIVQLHGNENNDFILKLKEKYPEKEVWKAFKIRTQEDIFLAQKSKADIILLDNGYGTGEVFNWNLIDCFENKFILAGGIDCNNIIEAEKRFKPYIFDVSSSVETDKVKDYFKIKEIIDIVRSDRSE